LILKPPSANALGNIRPNAVRRPNELLSNRVLSQSVPFTDDFPDVVSQRFRQFVNAKFFEIRLSHSLFNDQ
jgi:hypothetical protein